MRKTLFVLLIFLNVLIVYGQADSIEYNEWEQVYDFKINEGKYTFRSLDKTRLIEEDSIIFNTSSFFSNFDNEIKKPNYEDSIVFIIVSRTLKSYKEPILYDKDKDYIRIIYFNESITNIVRLQYWNDSMFLISKKGDGNYIRKGKLKSDNKKMVTIKERRNLENKISRINFLDLKNIITCPDTLIALPRLFWVEVKKDKYYNVFTVTECNFKDLRYKHIYSLYKSMIDIKD